MGDLFLYLNFTLFDNLYNLSNLFESVVRIRKGYDGKVGDVAGYLYLLCKV